MVKRSTLKSIKEAIKDAREILEEVNDLQSIMAERSVEQISRLQGQMSLPALFGIISGGLALVGLTVLLPVSLGLVATIVLTGVMTAVGSAIGHVIRRFAIQQGTSPQDRLLKTIYTLEEIKATIGNKLDKETLKELNDTLVFALTLYKEEMLQHSRIDPERVEKAKIRLSSIEPSHLAQKDSGKDDSKTLASQVADTVVQSNRETNK